MAVTTFDGIDAVRTAVGTHLGYSDWTTVTQEQVNTFAEATGDFQWIHVDVERANAESPFGGPIAHGYLTVSLTNLFLPQVVEVQNISAGLNRGTGKIRFPAPVPVGSRLRGGVELVAADDVERDGVVTGIDTTMIITVEREGGTQPGSCDGEGQGRWAVGLVMRAMVRSTLVRHRGRCPPEAPGGTPQPGAMTSVRRDGRGSSPPCERQAR